MKRENSATNSAYRVARDNVKQGGANISAQDRNRALADQQLRDAPLDDPVAQMRALENQFYANGGLTDREVEGINNARNGIGFRPDIDPQTAAIVTKQIKDQAKADAQKVLELQKKKADLQSTMGWRSKAGGSISAIENNLARQNDAKSQKLIDEIDRNIIAINQSNLSDTKKNKALLQLTRERDRINQSSGSGGFQTGLDPDDIRTLNEIKQKKQSAVLGSGNIPSILGGINTVSNKETNPFLGLTLEKQGPLTPSQKYQNKVTLENSVFIPGSLSYLLGDNKPLSFSESVIKLNPPTQKVEGEFLTKDKLGDKTSSLELAFGSFIKGNERIYRDYYNTAESAFKFAKREEDITPTRPSKTIANSAFGGIAKAFEDSRLFNVPLHETLTEEYKAFAKETGKKVQNDPFGVAGEAVAESLFIGVTAGAGALASGISKGSKAVAYALRGNPNQKLAQSVGEKIFQTNTDKALGIKLAQDTTKTGKLSNAIIKSNRKIPVGVEKITPKSFLITAGIESKKPLPSILFNIGKNAKSTVFTPVQKSSLLTPKNLIVKGSVSNEFVGITKLTKNISNVKGTHENLIRVSSPSVSKFLKPEAKVTNIETSLLEKYGKTIVNAVDNPKTKLPYDVFATTESRNFIKGFASDVSKLPRSGSLLPKPKTNIIHGNKTPFRAKPSVSDLFKRSKTTIDPQKQFNNSIRNIVKAESRTQKTPRSNPYGALIGTGVYSSLIGSRITSKPSKSKNGLFQNVRNNIGFDFDVGLKRSQTPRLATPQKPDTRLTTGVITTPITTTKITPTFIHPPTTTTITTTTFFPPTLRPPEEIPPVLPFRGGALFFPGGGRGSGFGSGISSATKEYSTAAIDLNINRKVLPGAFIKKSSSSSIFRELDRRQAKADKSRSSTMLFGGQVKTTKKGKKGKSKSSSKSFSITGSKSRSMTQRALGL